MWRCKDVVYNILGYLVFAMPTRMPFIAYREPRGGPPGPPHKQGGGGCAPPPSAPPAMHVYQTCELFAKAHGVGIVVVYVGGVIVVVDMPLWVTSHAM